ncbi:MAG: hypothetical protein ACOYJ2_01190 [Rickettsiales bacterium]
MSKWADKNQQKFTLADWKAFMDAADQANRDLGVPEEGTTRYFNPSQLATAFTMGTLGVVEDDNNALSVHCDLRNFPTSIGDLRARRDACIQNLYAGHDQGIEFAGQIFDAGIEAAEKSMATRKRT